jgi:hypothetical protein
VVVPHPESLTELTLRLIRIRAESNRLAEGIQKLQQHAEQQSAKSDDR